VWPKLLPIKHENPAILVLLHRFHCSERNYTLSFSNARTFSAVGQTEKTMELCIEQAQTNGQQGQNARSRRLPEGALGFVAEDGLTAVNERVLVEIPWENRGCIARDRFVLIDDPLAGRSGFLGRVVVGPLFRSERSEAALNGADRHSKAILAEVELHGELVDGRTVNCKSRPAPGSVVREMNQDQVADLLGFAGDMCLGGIAGQETIWFRLQSKNKGVLPRNLGIFGTVGSGKSNTSQVVIEEAAATGWAVIVLDVEGEYTDMKQPSNEQALVGRLGRFDRAPAGLPDFQVYHPSSCATDCSTSESFTLRLADFESSVIAEILQTTMAERNALLDCIEHLENKARTKVTTSEIESLGSLLDASPQARLPFTLRSLKDRAGERSTRNSDFFDYTGLSTKLMWLLQSGAFDATNMSSLDAARLMKPGRVSVFDVSMANDIVKNLVTADLLRKVFAWKIARVDLPPTLLVIEEAHSFISKEKVQTMQATMQMLRNVARRGRKRWLSMAFVSQQPGHLPPEIFELCNTRIVHTLRSSHNLEALMTTAGDVGKETWARCPLLGQGEAIVTSPQLNRPVVVSVRPAMTRRKFVR
jgi:DNA helicase HerA-like ATPase